MRLIVATLLVVLIAVAFAHKAPSPAVTSRELALTTERLLRNSVQLPDGSVRTSTGVIITPQLRDEIDQIINAALTEKTTVFDRLAYICDTFGPRLAGSEGLEQAIHWVYGQMLQDNIGAKSEPVMVPKWVRGNEYARMIKPRVKNLHFAGLGGSIGTNGKVIEAAVLVVKSFDELTARKTEAKGKIVVFNVDWVSYGANVAYRYGAALAVSAVGGAAALVRSVAPYGIQTVHTGSSGTASVPSGCISSEDALQLQRMQDRGQQVVIQLSMEARTEPDVPSANLMVEVVGSEKPDEYVVIGGHIDSWDIAEGAMDDGAGAVASWEAVRIIKNLGLKPRRTIRAVMWVNEENGNRGGEAYAKTHNAELNRTSIAIETDAGTFIPFRLGFEGSPTAYAMLQDIGAHLLAKINAGNVTNTGSGTDISPMCARGVPCAAMEVLDPRTGPYANNPCLGFSESTSQPAGEIPDGYFWYHHTDADTVDKLNPTQLQLSAAAMASWAYAVASLPDLLPR